MWIFFISNLAMGASAQAAPVFAMAFVDPDAASLIMIVDTTVTDTDPDAATLIII